MKRDWYDSDLSVAAGELPVLTLMDRTALSGGAGTDDERLHSSDGGEDE